MTPKSRHVARLRLRHTWHTGCQLFIETVNKHYAYLWLKRQVVDVPAWYDRVKEEYGDRVLFYEMERALGQRRFKIALFNAGPPPVWHYVQVNICEDHLRGYLPFTEPKSIDELADKMRSYWVYANAQSDRIEVDNGQNPRRPPGPGEPPPQRLDIAWRIKSRAKLRRAAADSADGSPGIV